VSLPRVTCVMTAFNYERYVAGALSSVLEQDYPAELLDVVVVDDGSTDGTADAIRSVQATAGSRVTMIQVANSGLAAATEVALRHADGELVAICDADDEWLPGKVRAQVEILAERPEVALVYGDMQVVDEHGHLLAPSFFARQGVTPLRGRVLDELVAVNFTTNSTLMLRAAHVLPIPARSPYADYWLVMHAAAAGELEVIERPLSNYRLHASNMNFGAEGEQLVRELKRELTIRRLILTSEVARSVSIDTLIEAARELQSRVRSVAQSAGTTLAEVVEVTDADREGAAAELSRRDHQDADERLRISLRAWLLDPFNAQASATLTELVALREPQPTPTPEGEGDSRRRITVASAGELIAAPQLVASYCDQLDDADAATLVIISDEANLQAVGDRLRRSLLSVGVDPDDCPEMVLIPASAWRDDYAAARWLTAGLTRAS
jgi:glycosyl transferase family 2